MRSLRSSLMRIAQGRESRRPWMSVSSSSHGMPAVPLSSSICISVVPLRNGSISIGTSSWNSVRPICGSALRSFDAPVTRLSSRLRCVFCARTSLRARLVSSV